MTLSQYKTIAKAKKNGSDRSSFYMNFNLNQKNKSCLNLLFDYLFVFNATSICANKSCKWLRLIPDAAVTALRML